MADRRESINWRIAAAEMVDGAFVTPAGFAGSAVRAAAVCGDVGVGSEANTPRGIGGGAFALIALPAPRRIAACRFGGGRFIWGRPPA